MSFSVKNKSCIILGSGPSLDGFDYRCLDGRNVIAVNDAGLIQYPAAQTLISTDERWWMSVAQGQRSLSLSKANRIICTEIEAFSLIQAIDGRVRFVHRKRQAGISNDFSCLYGMYTGVHAALNLAVQDGAQRIALLGIDLRPSGKRKYTYGGQITERTQRQFLAMKDVLEHAAQDLARMRVSVLNGSPDSALTCWPRMTPQEAVALC